MQAEAGVVLAHATAHEHIVGLLKADAVAVVISDRAILHDRAEAAIEEDAAAATAVERDVLGLVAIDDEMLHARALDVIAADDRKDRRSLGLVRHHAIRVQRLVDGEGASILPGDPGDGGVESAGTLVPDGNAVTGLEALRIGDSDLFLAEIAIQREWRNGSFGFPQNRPLGLRPLSEDKS